MDNAGHNRARCEGEKVWFRNETLSFGGQDPDAAVGQKIDEVLDGRVIMAFGVGGQGSEKGSDGFT